MILPNTLGYAEQFSGIEYGWTWVSGEGAAGATMTGPWANVLDLHTGQRLELETGKRLELRNG
jgi:hypothetical protein